MFADVEDQFLDVDLAGHQGRRRAVAAVVHLWREVFRRRRRRLQLLGRLLSLAFEGGAVERPVRPDLHQPLAQLGVLAQHHAADGEEDGEDGHQDDHRQHPEDHFQDAHLSTNHSMRNQ